MMGSQEQMFFNKVMDKSAIKHFISRLVCWRGQIYTTHVLDQLKILGFGYSTKTGFSLGIDDLAASPLKTWIIQDAENETNLSQEYFRNGSIHAIERLRQIIETWHTTSEFLKREMSISFNILDLKNPVHMMSFSGARGNTSQVHQLVGMRGLISDPQGNIVDLPIQNNLREGLSLTEYIISCYGARKGVVDTAIRTADAGYLTRRLVQVAQHIIVRTIDCNTIWGVFLRPIQISKGNYNLSNETRLIGRVLARPIYIKNRCLANRNQDIGTDLASKLTLFYKKKILVRSTLGCKNINWACQMCYGWGYIHGKMVSLGEAIGVIAGQSIGEPGTQLTLRTFHTGGVFTGDISSHIRAPFNGIVKFESIKCVPTRNRHGRIVYKCMENVSLTVKSKDQTQFFIIPLYSLLFITNNQYVEAKQIIAEVRTSISPFKEQVKRHIYSTLQGEVIYKKDSLNSLTNNMSSNQIGHVLVWSTYIYQFSDYQVQFCMFYQIADYIDINLTIGNQYFDKKQKTVHNVRIQSVLRGTNFKFLQLNNKNPGIICYFNIEKSICYFNILILSVFDQFEINLAKTFFFKEPIKNNSALVFDNKQNQKTKFIFITRNQIHLNYSSNFRISLALNYNQISKKLVNGKGFLGKTFLSFQYFYICKTKIMKYLTIFCNICFHYKPIWNNQLFSIFWLQINEQKEIHRFDKFHEIFVKNFFYKKMCFYSSINQQKITNLGKFMWKNAFSKNNKKNSESGKIISLSQDKIILRLAHTFLLTAGARIHVNCYDIINKGDILITLMYEQLRTSDIIQGLPKAEQLLEARSINEVVLKLENSFFSLTKQIIQYIPNLIQNYSLSTQKSYHHSQIELVNRIQAVYLAQGVHILDKHIELIVRQMSSKILILENCIEKNSINNYAFLPGEIINLIRAYKINSVIQNSLAYKPLLLGISRASLNTQSFISEASFQQTAKVLSKSALQGRIDWLNGLQENVIFGRLIPAGTAYQNIDLEFTFFNKIINKKAKITKHPLFFNSHFFLGIKSRLE